MSAAAVLDRALDDTAGGLTVACGMGSTPLDLARPRGPVAAVAAAPVEQVLGFAFSRFGSVVLLIRKSRPEWQAGKLNGIGGKIEPGETPLDAMVREFREETGLSTSPEHWRPFLRYVPGEHGTAIHCFSTAAVPLSEARQVTDEEVRTGNIGDLLGSGNSGLVPSVRWLLPMARFSQFDAPLSGTVTS